MSRARHEKKHRAGGGEVSSKIGNPNVFRLAEGKERSGLHGEEGKGHLGRAKGGKIKAHKRAHGGKVATEGNFSSAKLEKGGMAHDHHPLHHKAESAKDGVPHRGRK